MWVRVNERLNKGYEGWLRPKEEVNESLDFHFLHDFLKKGALTITINEASTW